MNEKLQQIKKELNTYFIERDEEIDCILTAILAKQHCLFLGAPGTAKSMLCRAVASHIEGAIYFDRLLTKFTTPEEVFGAYDLSKLQNGVYERVTTNKLPEAHFAFLDEIFKASSAILNSILTIINERIFHNDSTPQKVPLISLFTASNELPDEEEGLQALYDRLVIRKVVNYISDYTNLQRLLELDEEYVPKTTITLEELQQIHEEVRAVNVKPVISDILEIKRDLENEGIAVSDRRLKQSVGIVRAFAYLNGRTEATSDDLSILQHVFWSDPREIQVVRAKVLQVANPYAQKAAEFEGILTDLEENVRKFAGIELSKEAVSETAEIYSKVHKIILQISELIKRARSAGKRTEELERVLSKAENLRNWLAKDILGLPLERL